MRKMVLWAIMGLFATVALLGAASGVLAQDGKAIYMDKCMPCHGEKGNGKGPMASTFSHHPGNFCDPKFWQGDVDAKITGAVTNGKDQMVPVNLKTDEIKAVIGYIKNSCKK